MARQICLLKTRGVEVNEKERGFALANALRGNAFININVLVSRQCNMQPPCQHCHADSTPKLRQKTMSEQTARAVFRNLTPLFAGGRVEKVYFSGGEPLMHPRELVHAVKAFAQARLETEADIDGTVLTNGLLLKPRVFERLLEIKEEVAFAYSSTPNHPTAADESRLPALTKMGFDVRANRQNSGVRAVGRGFDSPNVNQTATCLSVDRDYDLARVEGRGVIQVTTQPVVPHVAVDWDGTLYACCLTTQPLGNFATQTRDEIVESMLREGSETRTFLEFGPLGIAQARGKLVQAIEVMKTKGVCGACYALQAEKI